MMAVCWDGANGIIANVGGDVAGRGHLSLSRPRALTTTDFGRLCVRRAEPQPKIISDGGRHPISSLSCPLCGRGRMVSLFVPPVVPVRA
eukprot:5919011-Pyramimonas_sp.AAC.1